jgi:hypothetical protein
MATNGMSEPAEYDIVIKKGAEFELPFIIETDSGVEDISTWSFKAQVRSPTDGALWLELYVVDVDMTNGSAKLWASASATGALTAASDPRSPARFAAGNWDFFAAPSAATATADTCFMQGVAKIYPRYSVR